MLPRAKVLSGGAMPLIGGLALIVLGAIAFALPQPPIAAGTRGACLLRDDAISEQTAEILSRERYASLVADLTNASLHEDAYWRGYVDGIRKRRFPVWGWVRVDGSARSREHARAVLRSVNLAGLYVYGPGSVGEADALGRVRAGVPIIPVLAAGEEPPADGPYGMPLDPEAFAGPLGDRVIPVLSAARMSNPLDVRRARAARGDETYIVSYVALLD